MASLEQLSRAEICQKSQVLRYLIEKVRVAADLIESEINPRMKQNHSSDFTKVSTYSAIALLEPHLQCLFKIVTKW